MASSKELFNTLAQVGRAFGSGHRLALLERLAQGEASVEALADSTQLAMGSTSQHLQHLRRAGLVTARRSGKHVLYRLTDERIVQILGLLRDVAQTHLAEAERLVSRLFADDPTDPSLQAVSRDELLAELTAGRVTLIDVRPEAEYRSGHLRKAIHLPLDRLEEWAHQLPTDREIVAYCRGPWCVMSHEAVQRLRQLGYTARRFDEGFPEWKAAGLPVEQPEPAP